MPASVLIHPTSLRIPDPLQRAIKRLAKKQGCSIAFKINEILQQYVDAYGRAHPDENLR